MEFVQPIRSKQAIKDMKAILKGRNIRDFALFTLGINSGLRVSDLLNLKVSDVRENGKLKDRILIREMKTGKSKEFPLGDTSRKALKEYFEYRNNVSADQPLFPSRKGNKAITPVQVWRILNDAARTVGIKENIGTHTLRKTFGYMAYQSGLDITRIMQLLNHSSQRESLRYIGITQDELDDVYLNLNL